ncbi:MULTISPECIES: heavy-metal-associated domain-containing protein [Nocardia]|uniref:heavy-metal-associated domain-containing protein n=1 Tax=Nocardia TaxID=1817 RepID=UPI00030FF36A|nr:MULTISPECIES: heavy-metal-associated domain-containing protein [Nocardia]
MSEFVYTVRGMTCGHCADAVTRGVRGIEGVHGVAVDVASGRVVVGSARVLTFEEVATVVTEAGYELVG